MFARERGEDLAPSPLSKLFTDVLDEFALLRVQLVLREIGRLGDKKRHQALFLRIEAFAPYLSDTEGMVGVEHEAVKHQAHQAAVAAIGSERALDVLLNLHVRVAELRIHRDLTNTLLIG